LQINGSNYKTCLEGYRFGFNGKEKDDETYGDGNAYDFGARIYDARLGRWLSVDPLESKYPDLGPYIFVGNSPIMFIDPDGKVIKPTNEEGKKAINAMFMSFSPEKFKEVFGLIGDHTLGYKTDLLDSRTGEPYGPAKFKKTALENGVSKEDVGAAYQVYLALQSNKTLEVEVVKSSTAGTAKSGQDGSSVVDVTPGFTTNTKNRDIPSLHRAIINGEGSGGDAVYLPNEKDRLNSTPTDVKGMVMINGTDLNEKQEGKVLMGAIKQLNQNDETNKKGKK